MISVVNRQSGDYKKIEQGIESGSAYAGGGRARKLVLGVNIRGSTTVACCLLGNEYACSNAG